MRALAGGALATSLVLAVSGPASATNPSVRTDPVGDVLYSGLPAPAGNPRNALPSQVIVELGSNGKQEERQMQMSRLHRKLAALAGFVATVGIIVSLAPVALAGYTWICRKGTTYVSAGTDYNRVLALERQGYVCFKFN